MGRILASLLAAVALGAAAQERYPAKPVQMVVPLSPGTTVDIIARLYADRLAQRLGQAVIVQNRPGAGGTIAAQGVAASAPDGTTILLANTQHSVNPAVFANLPYDTLRDFSGIAMVADAPVLVYANPGLGAKTLAEFIALAKAKPGTINYGSAGVGSAAHFAGAYFASQARIDLVHVPYKATPDLVADIVTGRIQANFSAIAFMLAQVREGKVLALAVASRARVPVLPEVPTVAEAAIPGYESSTWYGFLAPARCPRDIRAQLAQALKQISEEREVKEKFAAQGIFPRSIELEDFDVFIREDVAKLGALAKAVGAKAN